MKEGFRQCTSWLHTWTGLVTGWLLFFVFVTGTAGYFNTEITRWMQPERPIVLKQPVEDTHAAVQKAMDRLEKVAPVAASWRITLPHESFATRNWQEFSIRWEDMPEPGHQWGASGSEKLDPVTGAVLPPEPEPRVTAGGFGLYRMHYVLHYMPVMWGVWLVGVATMLMLLAILTGVITHKKIFKDFFTFRPGKGQRSWLDAHNAVSVMALPFFLMITYSGLVFFMFVYMPAGRDLLYGSEPSARDHYYEELNEEPHKHAAIGRPLAPMAPMITKAEQEWGRGQVVSIEIERHEGEEPEIVLARNSRPQLDFYEQENLRFNANTGQALPPEVHGGGSAVKTQSVLLNLHEGHFAAIWVRWLYFVAGLLGCAMIGTGLVLWTVKRRKHHLASGREASEHLGVRLVENLNVATIAGLPLAVACYFLANRLLPVALVDRAAWEMHSLFAVWLATLFYAMSRPLAKAWIELLWGSCLAFAAVPLVNALTTQIHLGYTIADGEWVLAGFDLTMFALAALFAVMAAKVQRRLARAAQPGQTATAARGATPAPTSAKPAKEGA